jgi:chromate transporter
MRSDALTPAPVGAELAHSAPSHGGAQTVVPFADAFRFWVKLGFISFGGPAGQIAIMHRELVDRRRWISEDRFLHALNYCMLLPGPEAQQLAIYIGWLMHRTVGGIVAGAFFVIPSIFILLALSYIYAAYGEVATVAGVLDGFKPVVVAIVVEAVMKIGGRALKRRVHYAIAAFAFLAIYVLHVPFPLITCGRGLIGRRSCRKSSAHGGRQPAAGKPGRADPPSTIMRPPRTPALGGRLCGRSQSAWRSGCSRFCSWSRGEGGRACTHTSTASSPWLPS